MKQCVVNTTACADRMPVVRLTIKTVKQDTTGSFD